MTKDKNGQNRGGARTPEIPYRKVRLEFWDLFSKLVESNHMLNSVNERSDTWLREQFEKRKKPGQTFDDYIKSIPLSELRRMSLANGG